MVTQQISCLTKYSPVVCLKILAVWLGFGSLLGNVLGIDPGSYTKLELYSFARSILQGIFQQAEALSTAPASQVADHPDSICFIMEFAAGGELSGAHGGRVKQRGCKMGVLVWVCQNRWGTLELSKFDVPRTNHLHLHGCTQISTLSDEWSAAA